jgi:alkylresorcinol/alkylpyrone synthase
MTQILSVRSAFPPHRYTQAELTGAYASLIGLRPGQRHLLERLHGNAGVRTRHTVLALEEYGTLSGAEGTNDRYIEEATTLGEQALRRALAAAGKSAADVDLLIVTSVTGVAVPSLDARLIPRLGLRPDVKRLPIFGLGCVAGAAGLARLHDYLTGWPGQVAALLAVELCTLTVPSTGITTADMVVSGLFGDGAAAVIATGDNPASATGDSPATGDSLANSHGPTTGDSLATGHGPATGDSLANSHGPTTTITAAGTAPVPARPLPFPRVLATRSEVYPDTEGALGWRLGSDGFRIVLTTELATVVEQGLAGTVTSFLATVGLTVDDIETWICHPGGPKVLDAVRDSLKLPEKAIAPSRRALAEAGNLSSASVLCILEQVARDPGIVPGSLGLMVGLGPGVSAELILLQW